MMAIFGPALVPSILAALIYLGVIALATVVCALKAGGRRDDVPDADATRSSSRFTIPVSVIVSGSVSGGGADARALTDVDRALTTLSGLNYPEFELIAVVDQTAGPAFDALRRTWRFEPKEFFYRQSIATAPVRRLYRSGRDSRVMLVEKAPGTRVDAVNCGVNIARFRYVTAVDPRLSVDPDALLRLMAAPLRNPGAVVGAGNHIERLGLFERLGSVRALMASRLIWRHIGSSLGTHDQVSVWRRDTLLDMKGFSPRAFDPDLDMARRAVTAARMQGAPARFHRGADVFGTTPARPLSGILKEAGRRPLRALQGLRVLSPRGLLAFGADAVTCFVLAELLTPLAEAWTLVGSVAALAGGSMSLPMFAAILVLLGAGHAAVTTAALLMRGVSPGGPAEPLLVRLAAAGPLELFCYRPVLLVAGVFRLR